MYRQIIVPTEKDHSINLPEELYGFKVEVLAFPIEDKIHSIEATGDADAFYDKIKLDFSGFNFSRDEANER
jgi:hypothetical protein